MDLIHKSIVVHQLKAEEWFKNVSTGLPRPIYSSYDLRDSGDVVAPVDANIFPAGFNNICDVDKENAPEVLQGYLKQCYPNVKKILLLAEEHTSNKFYWDNISTLFETFKALKLEIRIALPREFDGPLILESASGKKLEVHSAKRNGDKVLIDGFEPELIISNNDFSEAYQEWMKGLVTPINPPHAMGWHSRKKSDFFKHYNDLASQFAEVIDLPAWRFQVQTELYKNFDINSEESRNDLSDKVSGFIEGLKVKYKERGIDREPFVFIKNNSGTYGLGVIQVKSAEDIKSWNSKSRKKMKAAKGGGGFDEVIIQEGIPTKVTSDDVTAEPAIYMMGCSLLGGFLRTHAKKGPEDSLNSPGAIYKKLCVTDLNISAEGNPLENVYGWVAKIGLLAVALEGKEKGIVFCQ